MRRIGWVLLGMAAAALCAATVGALATRVLLSLA